MQSRRSTSILLHTRSGYCLLLSSVIHGDATSARDFVRLSLSTDIFNIRRTVNLRQLLSSRQLLGTTSRTPRTSTTPSGKEADGHNACAESISLSGPLRVPFSPFCSCPYAQTPLSQALYRLRRSLLSEAVFETSSRHILPDASAADNTV